MMSSRTALALLTEAGEPMTINPDDTVAAQCINLAQLRRWFIAHGFRADGERSAMTRWLNAWLESGQIVPWMRSDTPAWWFTDVPDRTAYKVVVFAEGLRPYAATVYNRDGSVNKDTCRTLGVHLGAFE